LAESANLSFRFTTAKHSFRFDTPTDSSLLQSSRPNSRRTACHAAWTSGFRIILGVESCDFTRLRLM